MDTNKYFQLGLFKHYLKAIGRLLKATLIVFVILFVLITVKLAFFHKAHFSMSGTVVDSQTELPIDSVKILTSESVSLYTDSAGYFSWFEKNIGSHSDRLEVLASKKGYQSSYFLLDKSHPHDITLKLVPGDDTLQYKYSSSWVSIVAKVCYILNILVILTMIFLFTKKVRYRWLWTVVMIFGNVVVGVNYITGEVYMLITEISYLASIWYPFTIRMLFPLGAILFWILYFTKREFVVSKSRCNIDQIK